MDNAQAAQVLSTLGSFAPPVDETLASTKTTTTHDGVIIPKQKDFFPDGGHPLDKINGNAISKEIAAENKKIQEELKKKQELERAAEPLSTTQAGSILDTVIGDTSKIFAPEVDENGNIQDPGKKPAVSSTKSELVEFLADKIQNSGFQPFNDYDEEKFASVEEYLNTLPKKDLRELLENNYQARETNIKDTYKQEVYNALPGHLKNAVKALITDGIDPREVYGALARVEQTTALDPTKEADQLAIAYNYLQTTQFGTLQEIEEQISEWEEQGKIEQKAKQFKPKLDKLQEDQVQAYAQQADQIRQEREQNAAAYYNAVVDVLKKGEVKGHKLGAKDQQSLYDAMLISMKPSQLNGELQDALMQKIEQVKYIKPDLEEYTRITRL